jgi:very-short-patch-repair endonuclease
MRDDRNATNATPGPATTGAIGMATIALVLTDLRRLTVGKPPALGPERYLAEIGVMAMPVGDERAIDEVALPSEVEGYTKRRVELVQKAAKDWRAALEDLGGRNNMLNYRDLKRGTLDLTDGDKGPLAGLLAGKSVKLSSLFGDPEVREERLRRIRAIHNKAKENFEERGLDTVSIGCGLATWENTRGTWVPSAPVLLRRASVRPLGAAQDEFELALVDDMEVNPTLLQVLQVDFGCEFDQDALTGRIPDGSVDEGWEPRKTYAWLSQQVGARVPGFVVDPRVVLANFAYAKLPMVKDIENAFDELVAHRLIAAIAGDEQAREAIREQGPGPDSIPRPDQVPLADEFLVLDADSSQNYAINSVLAGQSVIIKGPPGTGKSQTIANLIGALVARGKKVLFAAEKRAAIDAVTKRLNHQGLEDLVLDLHGGVSSRRTFAQSVGRALAASRTAPRANNGEELNHVEKRRDELNAYVATLHDKREPWGVSVYEMHAELLALADAASELRFRGAAVEGLGAEAARQAVEDLAEYARLGGLTIAASGSPWANSPVVSTEEVQQADGAVDELRRHVLPTTRNLLARASAETGLPAAESAAGWSRRIELWTNVETTLSAFTPAVYDLELEAVCESLAPAKRGGFARAKAALGSAEYKAARDQLRGVLVDDRKVRTQELYRLAESARNNARGWEQLSGNGTPSAPGVLADCDAAFKRLTDQLDQVGRWIGSTDLADLPTGELESLVSALAADRKTLVNLPELHRLERALLAPGLGEFLAMMNAQHASEGFAVRSFRYAWLQSILEYVSLADVVVGGFAPDRHERAIDEFREGDRHHIEATPGRIRRVAAETAVAARDEFKDQAQLVQHQAALKRRHLPVRDFVRNAPEVLLALKPCWAMSPLVVSQLLPARLLFDVVIFDEASQVTPADAVPAILRGRQLVVAGDEKQLPPTAFFVSDDSEEEEIAEDQGALAPLLAGTRGFESILDALSPLLPPPKMLQWHYRSRDERLIAFSNAHLYDRMLTTFAGVGGNRVLRYVHVPHDPSADTNSPTPEVDTVVDLIFEHARAHPDESLGVIAMGIKHANRIEERLRQRLRDDPDLEEELSEFFDESREERFFVKNLERVQGDERDAIILSIGYGKNARGDLPYRFGPLLTEGGERRLNVAVTRAKKRVALVSSFSHRDMDPERSDAEGVKLLRQYLQYVESDGSNLGDVILEKPPMNPFEVDVRDTLQRRGLKLTAQYGSSGYWIDFAVQHPVQPGRYVLAIECDGATYHSSKSARDRDRLRQEQLERLGWCFHRIWSSEWFYNKEAAIEKTLAAYELALREADNEDPIDTGETPAEAVPSGTLPAKSQRARAMRNSDRPPLPRGGSISDYSDYELGQLARWIESDDLLRTEDELLKEMMRELGFQRRGRNVVARLEGAIKHARQGIEPP